MSLGKLYELRERIFQDHVNYQQGLMVFLANDPSVPNELQQRVKKFGRMALSRHLSSDEKKEAVDRHSSADHLAKEVRELIHDEIDRLQKGHQRILLDYGDMLDRSKN